MSRRGGGAIPTAPAVHTEVFLPGSARQREVIFLSTVVTLKRNHEFQRLYRKGKSAASPTVVLYCRKNRRPESRLGLTVGKKVGGAVTRNRVRRRLREIYRLHQGELRAGYDIVVVARVKAAFSSYQQLERHFLSAAGRLGLRGQGEADQ